MNPLLEATGAHKTEVEKTSGETINRLFEAQAALRPNNWALKAGEEQISYAELNRRSNRLAHLLIAKGIAPEVPVALYLERSIEMVVSILAVLKAGGTYVPIDLAYPQERISFILEDTRAPLVITQSHLQEKLPHATRGVICVDEEIPDGISFENPAPAINGGNAAYIIYTSGSTGKPKGVIVTHRNVVRLLRSTEPWFRFEPKDTWALFHSYAFDMSVWELWGALFYGGKLVIVPQDLARSPAQFYRFLSTERVTFLNQTPSAFRQLIRAEATSPERLDLFLRFVTLGGEALELQSLREWFERRGDKSPVIVNMYGITETTVHTTYRPIAAKDLNNGCGSVIGVPIPDLQVHLLDEQQKPVARGEIGEICVGGAGVARGYLNRPELNAARFVSDPFTTEPGAAMYRSGDLARVNSHGEMEYIGRMDHQVKIRGFRVELGEIESALNSHPAIRESVAMALGDADSKRLVAYFIPRGAAPNTSELREYLGSRVPQYMVPSGFVVLDSFPLTNNGKINRAALPAPGVARPALGTPYAAPVNDRESALAEIWADVLSIDRVGRMDNFFELGGDSIRAIVLVSRARESGFAFSLEQLFADPTVASMAPIDTRCASLVERPTKPFDLIDDSDRSRLPRDIEDAYPITGLQLGMFFHNEMDPLSAMYHDVFSFRIQSCFDPEKLEEAVQLLATRHPALRTSFHLASFSKPLQLVHAKVRMPFSWEDLRERPQPQQEKQIIDWIAQEKRRAFNREAAPLMRFHAHLQADQCFQLFVSFHHCCTDGWSLAALVTQVLQDYSALLADQKPQTPTPKTPYREYAALELWTANSTASIEFWTNHLKDAPRHFLPRWPRKEAVDSHEQLRGPEIQIAPEVLGGLRRLARKAGVPLKTVLLAAHQRVMAVLYGDTDVTTGLVSNGRPEVADGDQLIGLFLNTIPIRQKLRSCSWTDLVRQTFANEQAVLPHRRFPLSHIQRLHGQALTETAFDFVHFHVYNNLASCHELRFAEGPYFEANNLTTYTTFMLDAASNRLELHIDYNPALVTREQIEQIDGYYLRTLAAMASDPGSDCLEFSPMGEERGRALREWNQTACDYPSDKTIHQLIREQALRNPNAVAVAAHEESLTYQELERRSDCLAQFLVKQGVTRETLVGICLDRSPRMMVALLATMKAGGAYVPLDPAFPRERLEFMIKDSSLRLVITEDKVISALPEIASQLLSLDSLPIPPADGAPLEWHPVRSNARDLAYVIYTSGSTGKPKGVQVEHRSVVNLLLSAANHLNVNSADNLVAVTTLSFDIAGLELFMPLICGAKVTIADRNTVNDGVRLIKMLDQTGATLMQGTPTTWRLLIEAGWQGSPALKIICGGEALPPTLAKELLKRAKEVWNFYGPTETTIWSTACKVDTSTPVTIGRPLANTQTFVLDARMEPVPVGTTGELWIGGHGLARGYLGRPELTDERFVRDWREVAPGERIYRTGDLARFLPDGRIECLGRLDHQVKIRGHRIELGEIETTLRHHGAVSEAVVTAREDRHGENRLTAYIVRRNGDPGIKTLREFLSSKLPFYMVPSYFVMLQGLPLTPNGKVDLKRLPPPEFSASAPTHFVSPEGPAEEALANIWQEALEVPRVGAEDNVFDLGADSLTATRAFARINALMGCQIGLREIFENPTVRSQAKLAAFAKPAQSAGAIKRQPRRPVAMALTTLHL